MTKSAAVRFLVIACILAAPLLRPVSGRSQSEAFAPPGELNEPRGDSGYISWTGGYVEAEGTGAIPESAPTAAIARLKAERAAKADALRNLLETTKGVRVTGETVVENFMTTSDTIRTRVEGFIKGAHEVPGSKQFDGQRASVRVRMPLWGDVATALYDAPGLREASGPTQIAPPSAVPGPREVPKGTRGFLFRAKTLWRLANLWRVQTAWAAATESGSDTTAPSAATQAELLKTGIILDLTETTAKPELFPRIVEGSTGEPIVDAKAAGIARASAGLVGYAISVEAAKAQKERVGGDPLIMKALNAYAGTNEGLKVDLAAGMSVDTAMRAVKNPAAVLKQGITVAYRIAW